MPKTWMERDARERAELIAGFLAGHARHVTVALPVGAIARLPGCPIRPGREAELLRAAADAGFPEDRDYHLANAAREVGSEAHCHRVTQALTVAARRGLVARTKNGRWKYWVPVTS